MIGNNKSILLEEKLDFEINWMESILMRTNVLITCFLHYWAYFLLDIRENFTRFNYKSMVLFHVKIDKKKMNDLTIKNIYIFDHENAF